MGTQCCQTKKKKNEKVKKKIKKNKNSLWTTLKQAESGLICGLSLPVPGFKA